MSVLPVVVLALVAALSVTTTSLACGAQKTAQAAGKSGISCGHQGNTPAGLFAEARKAEVRGRVVCGACDLKTTSTCTKMFRSGEDLYTLAPDGAFQALVTASRDAGQELLVRGKVAEKDGVHWLLALSFEPVS